METKEEALILGNIKELKEMLVKKAAEKVEKGNHDTIDLARQEHRQKKRGLLRLLKGEIELLETIEKAEDILKWDKK